MYLRYIIASPSTSRSSIIPRHYLVNKASYLIEVLIIYLLIRIKVLTDKNFLIENDKPENSGHINSDHFN